MTELIEGPDFFDYIKRNSITERMLKDLIIDVCCGLKYSHELGIAHRDIKLENVMIGTKIFTDSQGFIQKKLTPKLIDYGLSIVLTPG